MGQGLPAKPITRENWLHPENLRWALRHSRQVVPTAVVSRGGSGPVADLPQTAFIDLDDTTFSVGDGTLRLDEYLQLAAVDAFLVLHHGRVIYQRLFEGMTREQPHQWASMTKSLTGLLAALLAGRGLIDVSRPLAEYVPEMSASPFGTATVQQNLDMAVSVDWPTDVTEMQWMSAVGLLPTSGNLPATIRQFLPRVGRTVVTSHGTTFRYINSTTEAVAWALCNATGKSWESLVSEEIWSKLGAEQDASVIVDPAGTAQASGGFSSTIGDLARFAEAVRAEGRINGRQALSETALKTALSPHPDAADNAAMVRFAQGNIAIGRPGFSYRNGFFHVHDKDQSVQMSGRFGQRAHINPTAHLTIVQFASYLGHGEETASTFLAAMHAITARVAQ